MAGAGDRAGGPPTSSEKLAQAYNRLLEATGRVVGQAKRFAKEIGDGVKRATNIRRQVVLERLRRELESMAPRVRQVMHQTKARVFAMIACYNHPATTN